MNKKNIKKILAPISRYWLVYFLRNVLEMLYRHLITYKLHRKSFERLKKYKDIHRGERCFIIATGPSLTLDDVNMIKGEITFSMNSCFKLFDNTDWRPTYYCLEDTGVYERIKDEIDRKELNEVFIADYIKWNDLTINRVPVIANWARTKRERKIIPQRLQKKMFSEDIVNRTYYGTSVVHFVMQICFYMGFKEIYLIGTDCDFSSSIKHSKLVSYKNSNQIGNSPEDIYEGLMGDYEIAKKVAGRREIKIINATRGGKLELFPRVKIEDIDFLR